MKIKLILTVAILLMNIAAFSQQIGNGVPSSNTPSFNTALLSGLYQGLDATGQTAAGWAHLLNLRHSNLGNVHQLQISSSYSEDDKLYFRKFARPLGDFSPTWHEIATRGANTFNGNQVVNGNQIVSGELKISSYSPLLVLQRNTDQGGFIQGVQTKNLDNTDNWFFGNLYANSWIVSKGDYQNPKLTVLDNGNVGIGDSNPVTKFIIRDGGQALFFLTNQKLVGTFPATPEAATMTITSSGNISGNLAFATGNSENMRIIPNGNVGIGTTTPDQKLTVNGTIHAKEVIVDNNIFPDYVFQKYYTGKSELKSDYEMPTLAEIESFTKKNHHLPNVPSAKEIQENGVSLGEMSNVLLQKVEELTLYAIEQNKYATEQQKKLEEQNKTIATLAARLASFEKK